MRIPRWLGISIAATIATGALSALACRDGPLRVRALRAVLRGSTIAYGVVAVLDLFEHQHLEKIATGHYLRWSAVPLRESAVHAALIATNVSALALVRPVVRRSRLRDGWTTIAPAVFLAIGWLDELVFHRRRTERREDIIHTVQHLAEGVMWTALYAIRGPLRGADRGLGETVSG